mmetsp:Transcript_129034/g.275393  ORF Transcript_129034/g.275393 Transcript_129034/m.275393 type:complete len:133 (-) Transcript_129034:98-496(-)
MQVGASFVPLRRLLVAVAALGLAFGALAEEAAAGEEAPARLMRRGDGDSRKAAAEAASPSLVSFVDEDERETHSLAAAHTSKAHASADGQVFLEVEGDGQVEWWMGSESEHLEPDSNGVVDIEVDDDGSIRR